MREPVRPVRRGQILNRKGETMAEGQKRGDRLRIDYINSLPQPLWAETWKGDKWPVETICVQTGLVQCDIGGKIQTYQFEDITHFIDDEGAVHDPGTFEIDHQETKSQP